MESLIIIAIIGLTGFIAGLAWQRWLGTRPDLRSWSKVATTVSVGSATILVLGLGPPLVFWALLGFP